MRRKFHVLLALLALSVSGVALFGQTTDYFLNYPGGFTLSVYQVSAEGLVNPIELSWRVEERPDGQLLVTTSNQVLAHRDQLESGVVNGIAQTQLIIQDEAVRVLLQNQSSLTPNTTFIVPGGARFVTGSREEVNGVAVLCGLLTSDAKPNEKTVLGISADPTLPFPPFIQLVKKSEGANAAIELPFCTSLTDELLGSSIGFRTTFQLKLTNFERRE